MLTLIAALVLPPPMELGAVMNIDLTSESTFRRHFEIADGWASYIRVSVAMEQEGWRPESERLPFKRNRRLAVEARERGMGMDIHFGGVPHPDEWMKLGRPTGPYNRKKYSEMPREWWPKWAEFQKAAAKAMLDAYGPSAPQKIRFQLFNEPYSRGEDEAVDELMAYLIPRIVGKDGTVFGCPLDGPSLYGSAEKMTSQIDRFARFLERNPSLARHIKRVPLSMYPVSDHAGYRDPGLFVRQYMALAMSMKAYAERTLGRPVYFAEAGVGRVYDIQPAIFGARVNEVAEEALIASLRGFRDLGLQHVTIYQTKDHDEADARVYGYGLADRFGRLRVDLEPLKRLAAGSDR